MKKAAMTAALVFAGLALAPAAQAKPVPDSLKEEACAVLETTMQTWGAEATGDALANASIAFLKAGHPGMDSGTAAWAIVYGVKDKCPWLKDEMPASVQKYTG